MRKDICAKCAHEQPDGKCETRDVLDCGLDRYLADAVDEIEKSEEKYSKTNPRLDLRDFICRV